MAIDYTNDELIRSIKLRAMVPTSQATFLPDDMLQIANDELKNEIFPMIMNLQSAFFKTAYDYNLVQNETEIYLPPSAIGMKLNYVCTVSNANSSSEAETPMTQLEMRPPFNYWVYNGFWMEDNKVVVYSPNPQTVRLYVYKRPNKLVANEYGAKITAVDTNTNTITVENVPLGWGDGTRVCCVANYPGFRNIFDGQVISNFSAPNFDVEDVTGVTVGDWICLEDETVIAQIPVEAQPVLAQATAVKILESLKDTQGMQNAQAKLTSIIEKYTQMAAPRIDNSPKKVNNLNSFIFNNPFFTNQFRRW